MLIDLPLMIYELWVVSCSSRPSSHQQTYPTKSKPLQRQNTQHTQSSETVTLLPLSLFWKEETFWIFCLFSVKKRKEKMLDFILETKQWLMTETIFTFPWLPEPSWSSPLPPSESAFILEKSHMFSIFCLLQTNKQTMLTREITRLLHSVILAVVSKFQTFQK